MENHPKDQEHELKKIEEELNRGFHGLEKSLEIEEPDLAWFEQFTAIQIEQIKKKQQRDNWIFAFVGLTVLCVVLFTLYSNPILFAGLQSMVILLVIIYSAVSSSRKKVSRS